MNVYSFTEAREQLATILERAVREGQVKLKSLDGRIFVIRPEQSPKTSPFQVRSIRLPITKGDILQAIRDSRERF